MEIILGLRVEVPVRTFCQLRLQNLGKIYLLGTVRDLLFLHLQAVAASHHLINGTEAQLCHNLPHLLRDKHHEVHHVFRLAPEPFAQFYILRGNSCRTGILIADTHHHASHGDQRSRCETEFFRPQKAGNDYISAAHQLSVCLQDHPVSKAVLQQALVRLGQSQLPGKSRSVN